MATYWRDWEGQSVQSTLQGSNRKSSATFSCNSDKNSCSQCVPNSDWLHILTQPLDPGKQWRLKINEITNYIPVTPMHRCCTPLLWWLPIDSCRLRCVAAATMTALSIFYVSLNDLRGQTVYLRFPAYNYFGSVSWLALDTAEPW